MSGTTQRGTSPVAGAKKPIFTKARISWAICGVVLCVTVWAFWKNDNPPDEPVKEKLPSKMEVVSQYKPLAMPTAAAPPAPPQSDTPKVVQAAAPPGLYRPARDPVAAATASVTSISPPVIKPNMLSFAVKLSPKDGAGAPGGAGGAVIGQDNPAVSYAQSHLDGVSANLIGDDTFLIMPGLIACVLDTAIDSTFEGPIQCHLPSDVRPHGITLLGRNSIVSGYYSNRISNGQSRLQVMAENVRDPATGCFVDFGGSPMTDSLGRSGLDGNVDNHWPERIGAAALFSLSESALGILQAAVSKGGNSYVSFSSGGGGIGSLGQEILRNTINQPPTITKHEGEMIAIYVRKILNLAKCYSLQIKDKR